MVVNNIKEYSMLVHTIGNMEMKTMDAKLNIELESSLNNISNEMLNDLRCDLDDVVSSMSLFPKTYREVNRVINENFTRMSIFRRKKDMEGILESLSSMIVEFTSLRKNVHLVDCDVVCESYMEDIQTIYDNYISEASNSISMTNNIQVVELYEGLGSILTNIKTMFSSKHDKIVARDKQWLKDNKKKIFGLDWAGVQLEVPSDYKVSFASLINHHDIFDKECVSDTDGSRIRRFEDKQEDLKNGLDNYYRTGSSKREIGLRKVKGESAREAVQFMYDYCNDFINGKKYIEGKLDAIMKEVGNGKEHLKESVTILSEATTTAESINYINELYNELLTKKYKTPVLLNRQFGLIRIVIKDSIKNAKSKSELSDINKGVEVLISNIDKLSEKDPVIGDYLNRDDKHIKWIKTDFNELIKEREYEIQEGNEEEVTESYNSLFENINSDSDLIFISDQKFKDGKMLYPRIPDNFLVNKGYEDSSISRVCFAPSIDKALIALSANLKDKTLYVYRAVDVDNRSVIKPTIKQVPDVKVTGEVWVTKPVKIEMIKKIKIVGDGDNEYHYKYGSNTATLYDWKWETVYQIEETYGHIYEDDIILEEGTVTKSVKNAWVKIEDLDSRLAQALYGDIILNFAKHFGLARASARASVKLASLGPDIKYIKHENEKSIKTLTAIAKKKPGKNKPLENYIEWLENDFTKMIEEKEEIINKRNKKIFKESIIYEAEDQDNSKDDDIDVDSELNDVENDNDDADVKNDEGKDKEEVKDETNNNTSARSKEKDRQTGITVLMTIAEERYFDYIDTLKELVE